MSNRMHKYNSGKLVREKDGYQCEMETKKGYLEKNKELDSKLRQRTRVLEVHDVTISQPQHHVQTSIYVYTRPLCKHTITA